MADPDPVGKEEAQWAQELRRQLLQQGIRHCDQALIHASQCQLSQCLDPCCRGMKRIVHHVRGCILKVAGGCQLCGQLNILSSFHAKECGAWECPVPFCSEAKHLLRQRNPWECWKKRRQEVIMEARKAEIMRVRSTRRLPPFYVIHPKMVSEGSAKMPHHLLRALGFFSPSRRPTPLNAIAQDPLPELEKSLENLSTTEK